MTENRKPYTPEEWDQEETLEDGSPLPRGYGSQHPATKYEDDPRLRATVLALASAQARIKELEEQIADAAGERAEYGDRD